MDFFMNVHANNRKLKYRKLLFAFESDPEKMREPSWWAATNRLRLKYAELRVSSGVSFSFRLLQWPHRTQTIPFGRSELKTIRKLEEEMRYEGRTKLGLQQSFIKALHYSTYCYCRAQLVVHLGP